MKYLVNKNPSQFGHLRQQMFRKNDFPRPDEDCSVQRVTVARPGEDAAATSARFANKPHLYGRPGQRGQAPGERISAREPRRV